MLNGILATSLLFLACTPVVAEDSITINLSADAQPIPGGYVVPEGGNVTFTCNSSLGGISWTLDLKVPGGTAELTASAGLARSIPQVSSPDTMPSANPATITIHNVTSENNQSTVQCSDPITGTEASSARVIVEGSPNCPIVYTTANTTSLAVSIQKSPMTWLPEWYSVEFFSYNESMGIVVYNSTLKDPALFHVASLQPGTVYNISVIPCNMAGCNESCDIHLVNTETAEKPGTRGPRSDDTPHVDSTQPLIIGVAIVITLVLLLLVIIAAATAGCLIKRKKGKQTKTGDGESHYEDIVGVDSPYDDLVAMSTSLQGPHSSSVNAVHVHQSFSQLHSPSTSATAAQYVNDVTASGDIITMEKNPAYQSIEVAEAESATLESTQSDYI